MLKKTLLVLALSAVATTSAQAATVYNSDNAGLNLGGRLQANINTVTQSTDQDKATIEGYGRLNVDAFSKLGGDFKAIAFGEWEIATETRQNGTFDTRYAYVGIASDTYGSLTFGQDDTAIYGVIGATDIFIDLGNAGNTSYTLRDGRQEGQVLYKFNRDNFFFQGSYQTSTYEGVDGGYALSAGVSFFDTLPFGLNVGMDNYDDNQDFPIDAEGLPVINSAVHGTTTSYAISSSLGKVDNGFYGAVLFQHTIPGYHKVDDIYGIEGVLAYNFDCGLGITLGYNSLRQNGLSYVSDFLYEVKYNFTPEFLVYLQGNVGVGDLYDGERGHDGASLRLQYNF